MHKNLYILGTTVCSDHPESEGLHTFQQSDIPQIQEGVGEEGEGLNYPVRTCIYCHQPCISGAPQRISTDTLSPGMQRLARAKSGQMAV
jgi:hypothetical protein